MIQENEVIADDGCATPELIPVNEAISRILDAGSPVVQSELLHVEHALGRVIAKEDLGNRCAWL